MQANRLEKKAKLDCTLKLNGAIRPKKLNISIPYSNEYSQGRSTLEDLCKWLVLQVYIYIHLIIVIAMYIGEDDERDDNQLCIEGLQNVFSLLIKAAKDWFDMGLALGIKVDTLEVIKSRENCDKARLREMLTHWLRSSPSRTWSDICNGLRSDTVQQDVLADTIEGKYKGTCIHAPNTQNYI